jgi:hypothetical protein
LLTAAERYQEASRPLLAAKAYEAAAAEFLRADEHDMSRLGLREPFREPSAADTERRSATRPDNSSS